ncbi:MAG TPA: CoA-transferase [Solirubrobacteraceae bacterium]|nr:CoA-transferase [Solirubrobacteraceae bacterium]
MEMHRTELDQLAGEIDDGAVIGIGGAGLQRKPIAALAALVAAGRRDLRVVSFLGSLDVELLLAADAVAELHSAGVSLDGGGLAPLYRAARQDRTIDFHEWSEGTLLCALQATARGVPSLPTWMALNTDLPQINERLRVGNDPFTADPVVNVRALAVDVALLHVPAVDALGNAYVDGDLALDGALARAAGRTVVCYERVIEPEPSRAALSRLWVDAVVPSPAGAWPTGCHPSYGADLDAVVRWASGGKRGEVSLLTRESSPA